MSKTVWKRGTANATICNAKMEYESTPIEGSYILNGVLACHVWGGRKDRRFGWVVTHIASGHTISRNLSLKRLKDAKEFAERAYPIMGRLWKRAEFKPTEAQVERYKKLHSEYRDPVRWAA